MERQITTKTSRGNGAPAAKQSRNTRVSNHPILRLQQTIGNQAVQRLLQSGRLQTKLGISQPGDKYEQEADRVAETVMRMPEPVLLEEEKTLLQPKTLAAQISPLVQREEESQPNSTAPLLNRVESTLQQTGRPLDPAIRNFFEPRFGIDFGDVRIHTDHNATLSASDINARAYTVGRDIVFNSGQYAPHTHEGRLLLAHELTHVAQQSFSTGMHLHRLQTGNGLCRDHYGASESAMGFEMESGIKRAQANSDRSLSILGGLALGLSLTPSPVAIHRAIVTHCLAPSEVPSITQNQASSFGRIAEYPIIMDYCRATGGCALLVSDYIDNDMAASYIAFLAAKNPHLTTQDIIELALAATVTGGLSRPDVLTHKPPRFEFEEVKPDSVTGRLAGRLKLSSLATLFARFSLPYLPGATWTGAGTVPLFTLPGGVTVFLEWHRNVPGLVVYNLCVRGEASVLAAYGVLAILIAAILILLTRGRILRGGPAPLPIPAFASAVTSTVAAEPRRENELPVAQGGVTERT